MGLGYIGKNQLIVTTQKAYHRVSKMKFALFTSIIIIQEYFSKLWLSIIIHNTCNAANVKYFIDRQFGQNDFSNEYNKGNKTDNCYNNNNSTCRP